MSDEEPRRFGLTRRQLDVVGPAVIAAPFLLILMGLGAWAYASSTGMAVFLAYVAAILALVFGYQLVTGRDIAASLPTKRQPPQGRP